MITCYVCGKEQASVGMSKTVSVIDKKGEANIPRSVVLCDGCQGVEKIDMRTTVGK